MGQHWRQGRLPPRRALAPSASSAARARLVIAAAVGMTACASRTHRAATLTRPRRPPEVVAGIMFGLARTAPEDSCTGDGFDSAYTSVSLGKSNGVFQIAFAAYLNAEISVGPLTLDEISFNIIIPIPKLSRLAIDIIELAPQHTVRFECMVGYKPYAVFANALFNGFLPYFYIPFFTAGDFFVEADISKAPTIAFGGTLRFGRDCLDERGRPMESAGCGIARGVVGVGADLPRDLQPDDQDAAPVHLWQTDGRRSARALWQRRLPGQEHHVLLGRRAHAAGRAVPARRRLLRVALVALPTVCSRSHRCASWSRSRQP